MKQHCGIIPKVTDLHGLLYKGLIVSFSKKQNTTHVLNINCLITIATKYHRYFYNKPCYTLLIKAEKICK